MSLPRTIVSLMKFAPITDMLSLVPYVLEPKRVWYLASGFCFALLPAKAPTAELLYPVVFLASAEIPTTEL